MIGIWRPQSPAVSRYLLLQGIPFMVDVTVSFSSESQAIEEPLLSSDGLIPVLRLMNPTRYMSSFGTG